jgi:uncharacterized iron-regulated membrane protein
MTARALKGWYRVHKWTSLACTLFLLVLCLSGLPLIFKDEIGEWTGTTVSPPEMAANTPLASIDRMVEDARKRRPGDAVMYVSHSSDEPAWFVGMGKTVDAAEASAVYKYDARTADMIHDLPQGQGFMFFIRTLHVELFAGLPGTLFVGAIGLCFVASLVSGVVLYAPFMRRLDFGTLRGPAKSRRRWLDLHNLLGIVATAWLVVVSLSGIINTLTIPLVSLWQRTELTQMTAAWRGQPTVTNPSPPQAAIETAQAAVPSMEVAYLGYPGGHFSTPHHYMVFMRGNTALTARLFKPVLIDAETGRLTDSRDMPWYLTAILIGKPLHFGDYGGLPLKIIWTLLDLVAIGVLVSGLYLWLWRRSPVEARLAELEGLAT